MLRSHLACTILALTAAAGCNVLLPYGSRDSAAGSKDLPADTRLPDVAARPERHGDQRLVALDGVALSKDVSKGKDGGNKEAGKGKDGSSKDVGKDASNKDLAPKDLSGDQPTPTTTFLAPCQVKGVLRAVWASPTPGPVYAAGMDSILSWTSPADCTEHVINGAPWNAITGTSSSDVCAVGGNGVNACTSTGPAIWPAVAYCPGAPTLYGAWMQSGTLYAGGVAGLISIQGGSCTSICPPATCGTVTGVWGDGTAIYTVDNTGQLFRHNKVGIWIRTLLAATTSGLWGLHGWGSWPGVSLVAVGQYGTVLTYSAGPKPSFPTTATLYGVWGTSVSDYYVAGTSVFQRCQNGACKAVNHPLPATTIFYGVSGRSATEVFAVGQFATDGGIVSALLSRAP